MLLLAAVAAAGDSSAPAPLGVPPNGPPETDVESVDGASLISLRVAGSALTPREDDVSYSVSGTGGCTYVTAGDAFTVWNHKVTLPQGATVDTLRMYYYNTSGSSSTAWFTVYDLYGGLVDEWSVSADSSTGNSYNDSAQINHVIDYDVYSYLLNWRPTVTGSTMQLCGFRIFYSDPTIFRDGFEWADTGAWSATQP